MIKFRAWDKRSGIYLYDVQDAYDTLSGFVKYENGEDADYDEECFAGFLDNDQYVVEQFIGLKDVNGKEIYIGDIVNAWSDVDELNVVPSINEIVSEDFLGEPGVFLKPTGPHLFEPCLHDSRSNQFEVIGNVHTNHDLLEDNE
ncbi:hypothetical protein PDA01_06440 [Pediococcus damnosus]|uniref:YopX family protein n=1 Tax=Pediococcus damnosus TaxID=51663 RepID=UPI0011678EB3|nr:YopX family protein [Pediococcus damnosus]GEA92751.1 hypothetical protein PDA01_06440 [Pediococcus damnosus]